MTFNVRTLAAVEDEADEESELETDGDRGDRVTHDEEREVGELPTVCRACNHRTRMKGCFRCPDCHPQTSYERYNGDFADD